MPWFWIIMHKLKILNVNVNIGHENFVQCKFYVYESTDATDNADSCSKFASFILTLEKIKLKIWIHIKQCLSSANAISIEEVQNIHCVDAAASDAKIFVSDAWLASYIFLKNVCSKIFGKTLQGVYNMPHTFYLVIQLYKTIFLFMPLKYVDNRECSSRVVGY